MERTSLVSMPPWCDNVITCLEQGSFKVLPSCFKSTSRESELRQELIIFSERSNHRLSQRALLIHKSGQCEQRDGASSPAHPAGASALQAE